MSVSWRPDILWPSFAGCCLLTSTVHLVHLASLKSRARPSGWFDSWHGLMLLSCCQFESSSNHCTPWHGAGSPPMWALAACHAEAYAAGQRDRLAQSEAALHLEAAEQPALDLPSPQQRREPPLQPEPERAALHQPLQRQHHVRAAAAPLPQPAPEQLHLQQAAAAMPPSAQSPLRPASDPEARAAADAQHAADAASPGGAAGHSSPGPDMPSTSGACSACQGSYRMCDVTLHAVHSKAACCRMHQCQPGMHACHGSSNRCTYKAGYRPCHV